MGILCHCFHNFSYFLRIFHRTLTSILSISLPEKCQNTELFWSEYRKIRIRNNSVFVHFSCSVFFKHVCHANPGADKKYSRSSSYIFIHLLPKHLNTSANVSAWLYTNKPWCTPRCCISRCFQNFSVFVIFIYFVFHH